MKPRILLIHPPIYDFSAYDFWLKPYGMLRVAGFLRGQAEFALFDYLDRVDPRVPKDITVAIHGDGVNSTPRSSKSRRPSLASVAASNASVFRETPSKSSYPMRPHSTMPLYKLE